MSLFICTRQKVFGVDIVDVSWSLPIVKISEIQSMHMCLALLLVKI